MSSLACRGWMARLCPAALAAAVFVVAPAATAMARQGVYGGLTKAGDPIVLTSDAGGHRLTGVVFRIRVDGSNDWWPVSGRVTVRPGDDPSTATGVLVAKRNAGGRFSAGLVQHVATYSGQKVMGGVDLTGTLQTGRAKGTIRGWVTVTNLVTHQVMGEYRTTLVKWTAERAAGRVYAGATTASLPIVLKLDRRATNVSDLWFSCYSDQSNHDGWYWSSSELLGGFPLTAGRFADEWDDQEPEGYGIAGYHYKIAGRVGATRATGSIAMKMSGEDPDEGGWSFRMATTFTAQTG